MNDPTLTLKDVEEYDRARRRLADQAQLRRDNISLTVRLKKLREALGYYANMWNWNRPDIGNRQYTTILRDSRSIGDDVVGGQRAHGALIADDDAAAKGESKGEDGGCRADDKIYHSPPTPAPAPRPAPCTIWDARAAMLQRPGEEWTCGTRQYWTYRFDVNVRDFQEHTSRIGWRLWLVNDFELDATNWHPAVAKCEKCGQEVKCETTI